MGAGASISEDVDIEAAKTACGDKFDQSVFDAVAVDGKVGASTSSFCYAAI
jgi:hypothetical protein